MKRLVINWLLCLMAVVLVSGTAGAQKIWDETEAQKEQRMQWWTDARFGMFIHWGLYAMPARHEWVKNYERISDEDYEKYYRLFNPDLYDPREWAKMAKAAGMKYVVITTKHHEGFCLWDSAYTDYKVTKTPVGRDLLREAVDAFRAEGVRVGFYYSLLDWHHPQYTVDSQHPMRDNKEFREKEKNRNMNVYRQYMKDQLRELMTKFGEIEELFLDFSFPGPDGKGRAEWDSIELVKMIRQLQPQILIDDRADLRDVPGGWDYRTPEQSMPAEWVNEGGRRVAWETVQTFSGSWGYFRDETTWKSPRQLISMLIEVVSKGGNLLLNVGPTARGTFDQRAKDRLTAIGQWMAVNSRSIYGCTQAPPEFKAPANTFLTYNPKTRCLYVHMLEWPPLGQLRLDGYAGKVKYAQLLNDASEVRFGTGRGRQAVAKPVPGETLTLRLPILKPDTEIPVIELLLN